MNLKALVAASVLVIALPLAAEAQGLLGNPERGLHEGGGAIADLRSVGQRLAYMSYRHGRRARVHRYDARMAEGAALPGYGVTTYDLQSNFPVARDSRYTVVNEWPVLVDRRYRIIEVLR